MTVSMSTDEHDETIPDLGAGSPRGGEGLATGSAPQEGITSPDPDATVKGTARGGEGLATDALNPSVTAVPDPDESVQGTPRGGEGLADGAA
jgi:hypothetical protein